MAVIIQLLFDMISEYYGVLSEYIMSKSYFSHLAGRKHAIRLMIMTILLFSGTSYARKRLEASFDDRNGHLIRSLHS